MAHATLIWTTKLSARRDLDHRFTFITVSEAHAT
jgi:hypothetical protein